jgi:N-acetyltransferase 10
LLARTVETVEGGGIVVLLLKSMNSLKQLYTMTMVTDSESFSSLPRFINCLVIMQDVHTRYRTEAHQDVVNRFNERFILSLSGCNNCLVVDDELNVLPISIGKNVKPLPPAKKVELSVEEKQLQELKESLADTEPIGSLAKVAKTLDQVILSWSLCAQVIDRINRAEPC